MQGEGRTGEGREGSGWLRKLCYLGTAWLIAEVSVTFLCEKAGEEKTDRHMFFFTILFDPAVQGKKTLYIHLLQQKKSWGLENEEGGLLWEGRGADQVLHPQ